MPEPGPAGARRRVYLHIGLQKTGTSYLQGVMLRNRAELFVQGLDLVPERRRDAFEVMLQVRGRYNPDRDPASAGGALERFSAALEAAPGSRALLSQESLAASRRAQVRTLVEACGEREVHVVLTVRDLARQVPSSWQQELKAARTDDYEQWLERLQAGHRRDGGGHPWIQLDAPKVLERWSEVLPPEQVHVVTVPPPGSPTSLLLERYCRVLGVRVDALEPTERASNTSLGRVQAELLRRVNLGLPADLRRRQVYGDVGKRWFASEVLSGQQGEKILVPERLRPWCEEVADAQVAVLAAAGYRIEGDLDDLRCRDSAFAPDADAPPTEAEMSSAAVAALVEVVGQRATTRQRRRAGGGAGRRTGVAARVRRLVRRRRGSSQPDADAP